MYSRCEILFPHSRVSGLKKLKGEEWRELTEYIATLPETHEDALAFSHMMFKLCDCLNCDLGSYKAALGCAACSQRTINALRDTDQVTLRLTSADGGVEEILGGQEGVHQVSAGDDAGVYHLEIEPRDEVRERVAQTCLERRWGLVELHTQEASLEEVFLNLTLEENHADDEGSLS